MIKKQSPKNNNLTFLKSKFIAALLAQSKSHRETKKHLRHFTEQWQTVFNALPYPVFITDKKYRIKFYNKSCRKITRISGQKIIDKFCWQIIYGDAKCKLNCPYLRAKKSGQCETAEIKVKNRHYQISVDPIFDENDKFIGAVHSFQNITLQKKYESILNQSQEHYQSLIKNISLGVIRSTADGKILDANPATFTMFGFRSKKQFIRHSTSDFFPNQRDRRRYLRKLRKNNIMRGEELILRKKNGKQIILSVSAHAHFEKPDKIAWIDAIAEDITERKRVENRLDESENRFRRIVENSSDLIMLTRPDGVIEYLSPSSTKIIGYTPKDLTGKIPKIYHKDDLEKVSEIITQAKRSESGSNLEYRIITKKKHLKWVSHTWAPIKDQKKLRQVVSIVSDVTERKLAQEKEQQRLDHIIRYQTALLQISKIKSTDYRTAIKEVLEIDAELLNIERTSFWLVSEDLSEIYCQDLYLKSLNKHEKGLILYSKNYPYYFRAIQEGRFIAVSDVHNDIRTFEFSRDYYRPNKIVSMMDVPVWIHGKLTGIVCHEHTGLPRTWTTEEQHFAASVADTISLFIESHQRQIAQNALQESEEKYRGLIQNLNVGVFRTTPEGKIAEINQSFTRMFGYDSIEQAKKCLITDLYYNASDRIRFLDKLAKQGYLRNEEVLAKRKNGSIFEASMSVQAHHNKNGKIDYFDGVVEDISERKRIQAQIIESELKYRTLVDMSPFGISIVDMTGHIVYVNPSAMNILGAKTADQVIGQSAIKFVHPDYQKAVTQHIFKIITAGKSQPVEEEKYIQLDGTIVDVEVSARPFRLNNQPAIIVIANNITERKRIQAKIIESEEKYRSLVQNLKIGVFQLTPNGKVVEANPACYRLFGCKSLEQLKKLEVNQVLKDEHAKKDILVRLAKDRIIRNYEITINRIDGQKLFAMVTAHTHVNKHGRIESIEGVIEDITEQKLNTEMIFESEEKYRSLVTNINIGVYRSTPAGKFLEVNPAFIHIFGYKSANEVLKIPVVDFYINPQDRNIYINKIKADGYIRNFEVEQRKKDGTKIIVSITAQAHRDKNDKIIWYDGVLEDITERKQVERALQQSEQRYRTLFETANDGICIMSPDGRVIVANKRLLQMSGFKKIRFGAHLSHYNVFSPETLALIGKNLRARLAGGQIEPYEVILHPKKGNPISVEITAQVLRDAEQKVIGEVVFLRDISDRKKAERYLTHAKESAETANKAKIAFLHNMSHELRSPITSIIGFTNLLLDSAQNPENKEMLEIIKSSSNYLLRIVNNLLDLSRIEAGKITVDNKETDIIDAVNKIYQRYLPIAKNKKINLKLVIDKTLPQYIITDRTKIEQIINNLLDNSFKFTEKGNVELFVGIKTDKKLSQPLLNFYIKDTGIGIHSEQIKRIFEKFEQSKLYITKKYGGTGLGLTIIRQLADLLKGTVSVSSRLSKGTKFTIQIPVTLIQKNKTTREK